jgi:hypothetical protein
LRGAGQPWDCFAAGSTLSLAAFSSSAASTRTDKFPAYTTLGSSTRILVNEKTLPFLKKQLNISVTRLIF